MWVRKAFFRWLIPAAFVLPLWLLIGWSVFRGGWAIIWVLLIAVPCVFVGQLLLTLLTRTRGSVRTDRAVSWWDVAGFSLWHALTVALGFFGAGVFGWFLAASIVVGVGLFWLQFWQLWNEAKGNGGRARRPAEQAPAPRLNDVIVVHERDPRDD